MVVDNYPTQDEKANANNETNPSTNNYQTDNYAKPKWMTAAYVYRVLNHFHIIPYQSNIIHRVNLRHPFR